MKIIDKKRKDDNLVPEVLSLRSSKKDQMKRKGRVDSK